MGVSIAFPHGRVVIVHHFHCGMTAPFIWRMEAPQIGPSYLSWLLSHFQGQGCTCAEKGECLLKRKDDAVMLWFLLPQLCFCFYYLLLVFEWLPK